ARPPLCHDYELVPEGSDSFPSLRVELLDGRVVPVRHRYLLTFLRVHVRSKAEVEPDRLHDPERGARCEHVGRGEHAGVFFSFSSDGKSTRYPTPPARTGCRDDVAAPGASLVRAP